MWLRPLLVMLSMFLLIPVGAMAEPVDVRDPWVREVPDVSRHSAAYMKLRATADENRTLLAADSPQFQRVEIHESREEEGMARMVELDSLTVAVGETLVLEPGGKHLMLMDRKVESLRVGDHVDLVLHFDNDESMELRVPVRKGSPGHDNGHGHHHHH